MLSAYTGNKKGVLYYSGRTCVWQCIVLCLFLSFGFIDTDDNHFILNDVMTNSTIVLKKNDSDLIVDKGFLFMKEKCFVYEDEYNYFEYEHFLDIKKEYKSKEKNRERYLSN